MDAGSEDEKSDEDGGLRKNPTGRKIINSDFITNLQNEILEKVPFPMHKFFLPFPSTNGKIVGRVIFSSLYLIIFVKNQTDRILSLVHFHCWCSYEPEHINWKLSNCSC